MTSYAATATLAFDDGTKAQFTIDGAASMGRFDGEFVHQDAFLARDPKFPAWATWFRPDADGSRDEVVVEYGRKNFRDPDVSQGYTLTLADRAGDTIRTIRVSKHYRLCRHRWQSTPRPIVRKAADLYARGWMPRFGKSGMFGGGPQTTDYSWQGPFTPLPEGPHGSTWAAGGDHDALGITTEAIASFLIFENGNSERVMRADGEALGNAPMHYRNDDGSLPIFNVLDASAYRVSDGGKVVDWPDLDPASNPGFEKAEQAHWYASANGLWMLTEDPFMLEALQMGLNRRILENRTVRVITRLGGMIDPQQQRAMAWGIRDLAQCWATTPDTVPSWLRGKRYWKACLDDNRAFAMRFVDSPARIHSLFRIWTRPSFCSSWMAAWLSTACGIAVQVGLPEWRQVFDWSIGLQIAMASHPKWRRWFMPYRFTPIKDDAKFDLWKWSAYTDTAIDPGTCADFDEAFAFYSAGQNPLTRRGYGSSDDTGHLLFPDRWPEDDSLMADRYDISSAAFGDRTAHGTAGYPSFFGHGRAALAMAVRLGVPGARACYDYVQAQMTKTYANYGGKGRVTGQARFALEP